MEQVLSRRRKTKNKGANRWVDGYDSLSEY